MSAPPPVAVRGSLINRVKAILMQPKSEWQVIDGEPATVASIYIGYIVPLAAIPAICGAVWMARYTPGFAVRYAVTQYVLGLVTPFVFALIIDALARTFGGQRSQIQALKVAAYSWTAAWVAGIFLLIPGLGVLSIVGLYSLYLLYLGLPVLMKSPADRAMSYTIVAIIVGVVLAVVVNRVAWMVMGGSAFYGVYR
jgi:Yip1 domain